MTDPHRQQESEEERKLFQSSPAVQFFHAPPVTWRVEETRRHCSYRSRKVPSTVMDFLGSVFVILVFNVIFCLVVFEFV